MLALAAAAVLLIAGRNLAGVYSDYLWYDSLGAGALWRARMGAVTILRLGSGFAAGVFAFANLYAVRQSVISLVFPRRVANLEIGEEIPGKYLVAAAALIAVVLGSLLTMSSDHWMSVVLARASHPFGEADPYFGQDFGFFVYWLPLESAMWMWAFYAVIAVSVVVILLYALTPSLKFQRGGLYASTYVRRHVTVLVGFLLLLLAWSFRLDMYSLLIDGGGIDGAFSWADHRVGVPGDLLLSLITLGAALIVIWCGLVGQFRLAAVSVITTVVLSLLVRELGPAVASRNGTDAQRASREQAYIAIRATYTRRAFDVDAIPIADSSVAYSTLAAAMPYVSLWDPAALVRVTGSSRGGTDPSPLIGWRPSPTALVADVVESAGQGTSARTPWTAVRVVAADADERGAAIRVDPAAASFGDDISVEPPLVYPGAPAITVIADSLTRVSGTSLESFAARLATAWSLQNVRLLSGDQQEPHPTLISHRDVRDRLDMFAPFFAQGRSVEPILVGDTLFWAVDLYSASDSYPLSRHFLIVGDERSYLRHSAVGIVQASTGEVMIVPDSILDPIAQSWKTRLPSLFTSWSALPAGIRAQLPPPIDGILAQANAFGRYGIRGQNDVPRHIPVLDGADSALTGEQLPMVLPGGTDLALSIPLVDDGDRLRGLLIGSGRAPKSVAWYPLAQPGLRWSTVIDRLRSVDSAGSAAREGPLAHGRVRAIPVKAGIAFVQPSYRWRNQTIPTLNRIALLAKDSVRSVAPPFNVATGPTLPAALPIGGDLRSSVSALYAAMREALRRGDFAAFGRAFEALGRALNQPGLAGAKAK
jgi:uncharacterized membrane protein (UPF0182 family)